MKRKEQMFKFLNEIEKFYKEFGIVLDQYS